MDKRKKQVKFQPAYSMIVLGKPTQGSFHAVTVARNPTNSYTSILAGDNYKMLVNGQEVMVANDCLSV